MKAIIQHLGTGHTELAELPAPRCRPGHVLIQTNNSLISAGTERMLVAFGKSSLLAKAQQQPEKVRQVLDKIRTDGLLATMATVRSKLAQPIQLGYCNTGIVIESGVPGISVNDRVVSNGPHAEVVLVPQHLCARIPAGVTDETAAFTVVASIGLQGVRLAQPTIGERIVVIGVGLIGLLTVQILRANGCHVLAVDFDEHKLSLARSYGAETCNASTSDPVASAMAWSDGTGIDAALITAATASNEPVSQAARMCRKRGRIVLVGVAGLELNRAEFYHKELSFQVSCSYGPGRYDPAYEQGGIEYPIGYVRWTEERNLQAVLGLMADRRIDTSSLISHRFTIDKLDDAYAIVGGAEPSIGILLGYPGAQQRPEVELLSRVVAMGVGTSRPTTGRPTVGLIGSGNYATMVLIPALKAGGADLRTVVSQGGLSGVHAGRRYGFAQVSTDNNVVFDDPKISTVIIATRHNSHADLVGRALKAGKHVFVEKPLALTVKELDELKSIQSELAANGSAPLLMVGFNRRFAPQIIRLTALIAATPGPKTFIATINAGAIPPDHWTQDRAIGGGRIIGEACHFIDLLRHLAGHSIVGFQAAAMTSPARDTASFTLTFADGSIGTVHYFANGSKAYPKERIEVFAGNGVIQLDNFRRMKGFGWHGFKHMNLWRQDKGQNACALAFLEAVRSHKAAPIPLNELFEVSRVTIDIAAALSS